MALKKLEARHATKRARDYKLADGEGLHMLVRANGSKLPRLKYRFAGKEKLLAFGLYPGVSLVDARLRRAEAKIALGRGATPTRRTRRRSSRPSSRPLGPGTPTASPRWTPGTPHGC